MRRQWEGGTRAFVLTLLLLAILTPMAVQAENLKSGQPANNHDPGAIQNQSHNREPGVVTAAESLQITTTSPLPDCQIGVTYDKVLVASGGVTPYTWSIETGALPPGLILDPASGQITGSPNIAGGPTIFTVKVTDNSSSTFSKQFSISCVVGVTVGIDAPATVPAGEEFSINVSISGVINLNSYQFDLEYNNSVIQVLGDAGGTGVSEGLIVSTVIPMDMWNFIPQGTTGHIRVLGKLPGIRSATGQGYLAQVHVMAKGAAGQNSDLIISEVGLWNPSVISMNSTTYNDMVTISEPRASTTTALTSSINPSLYGQAVTFTAATSAVPPASGIPSGNVNFMDGLTILESGTLNGSGQATLVISSLTTGNHTMTAVYTGDSKFAGSTSPAITQIVNPSSSLTLTVVLQGGGRPDAGWEVPLTIKLFTPGADVLAAEPLYTFDLTTTKSGSTAITQATGITPGTYDINATSGHCLCNVKRSVVVTAPSAEVNMGTLLEGDANGNHTINIQDFGILAASYGKSRGQTGFDERADFNRNDNINITDFGLLAANYGKHCPVEIP